VPEKQQKINDIKTDITVLLFLASELILFNQAIIE